MIKKSFVIIWMFLRLNQFILILRNVLYFTRIIGNMFVYWLTSSFYNKYKPVESILGFYVCFGHFFKLHPKKIRVTLIFIRLKTKSDLWEEKRRSAIFFSRVPFILFTPSLSLSSGQLSWWVHYRNSLHDFSLWVTM